MITLRDGSWAPIEVKLGTQESIDTAASNLLKLREDVDSDKGPSFMMVLTATSVAYKRDDGVLVVPLGCLSP